MTYIAYHLPKIKNVLKALGVERFHGTRCACPIHRGENEQCLSFNDDRGVWFCHRCGEGGDAITLVMRALPTDFRGARQFLGLKTMTGETSEEIQKRRRHSQALEMLRLTVDAEARKIRALMRARIAVAKYGTKILEKDPDSEKGWFFLSIAYDGQSEQECILDILDACRTDREYVEAWRAWREERLLEMAK